MAKGTFDDEICQCGHSKGWHTATNLEGHGGSCEKCDCSLFTWKGFVAYEEWPKKGAHD